MVRGAKLNNSSSNRRHPALITQIRPCLALLAISHFINNSLQRGRVVKSDPTTALAVYSSLTKPWSSGAVNNADSISSRSS